MAVRVLLLMGQVLTLNLLLRLVRTHLDLMLSRCKHLPHHRDRMLLSNVLVLLSPRSRNSISSNHLRMVHLMHRVLRHQEGQLVLPLGQLREAVRLLLVRSLKHRNIVCLLLSSSLGFVGADSALFQLLVTEATSLTTPNQHMRASRSI